MNFEGAVLRLIPYSTNLVVFSQNTIGAIGYVNPDVIFGVEIYVPKIKLVGPRAVINSNTYVIFVGQDNLYIWDGGRVVRPMGDKIAPTWRTAQSQTYIDRTVLFQDTTRNQYRLIIPTGASTNRVLVGELSLSENGKTRWFEETYGHHLSCFGIYNISSQAFLGVVSGSDSGKVFLEAGETTDASTAITFSWDTGDFSVPEAYHSLFGRWYEIELEAKGSAVINVYYSIDHGSNWTSVGSVTPSSSVRGLLKLNMDVHARYIRLRFTTASTGATFELVWYRIWFKAGGAR
jgi:hypothetical protein